MDATLIKAFALLRPATSIEVAEDLFDMLGAALFLIMGAVFLANSATRKKISLSAIDGAVMAFGGWCVAIFLIYFEVAQLRSLVKLLVPLLSFTIAKNVIRNESEYRSVLFWMIVGFSIPVTLSVILIATGGGVGYVNYWTGIPRWKGAYANTHNFGHSMTLMILVLTLYVALLRQDEGSEARRRLFVRFSALTLGGLGLFCLYMSQVRSAIMGLLVFMAVYLFYVNRRLMILLGGGIAISAVLLLPYWVPVLLPDVATWQSDDISDIGSGRLTYWAHNLGLFSRLPVDQQIAGVGIGNLAQTMYAHEEEALDSHNDWLDVLMQTGLVGLALFAWLQLLILRAILRLPQQRKYFFLAMFVAVNVMMFVSNSYLWRIQVGHLYFVVLAFVELERGRQQGAAGTSASSTVVGGVT